MKVKILLIIIGALLFNIGLNLYITPDIYAQNSDDFPYTSEINSDHSSMETGFRNPFSDYRTEMEEDEAEYDEELGLDHNIPFKLGGIVSYDTEDLALLYSSNNSKVIREGEEYRNYRITAIFDDFIEVTRNQESRYMEIGGGLIDIEE